MKGESFMKKTFLTLLLVFTCIFCMSCAVSPENAIAKANKAIDNLSGSKAISYMACYGEGEYDAVNDRIYYEVYILLPDSANNSSYSNVINAMYFGDAKKAIRETLSPIFEKLDNFPDDVRLKMTIYTSDGYKYDSASGW